MAVPKKKIPRSKRGSRRNHQKMTPRQTQACPKCNEPKLPHRVCKSCGFYKELEVIDVEE